MQNFIFYLFILIKIAAVTTYISVVVWMFNYNMVPLINLYGGWHWLGINLLAFLFAFIAAFVFLWMPSPRKPQATPRPIR